MSRHLVLLVGLVIGAAVPRARAEMLSLEYLRAPDLLYMEQQGAPAMHGKEVFLQQCSFCHGKDAAGGDTGPDLTRSKLVRTDRDGNLIGPLVHAGRPDQGMPRFNLSDTDTAAIVVFLHEQANLSVNGNRRGVSDGDLQMGNKDAGRQFFNGAGGCVTCHSTSGDLAHIATRLAPLDLELRMLYPKNSRKTVTVTTADERRVEGTLIYQDEFIVALRDKDGNFHSFRSDLVQAHIHSPVDSHIELLAKYSDSNIHDLLAYLETLR